MTVRDDAMAIENTSARPRPLLPNPFRRAKPASPQPADQRDSSEARAAATRLAVVDDVTAASRAGRLVFIASGAAVDAIEIGPHPLILGASGKRNGQLRVSRADGAFVLRQIDRDAGATINGAPLGDRALMLEHGDEIVVDGRTMRFESGSARQRRAARRPVPAASRGAITRRVAPPLVAAVAVAAAAFTAAAGYVFVDGRQHDSTPPPATARDGAISATAQGPAVVATRTGTGRADVPASSGAFTLRVSIAAAEGVNWFWCFDDVPSLGEAGRYCRARVPADGANALTQHEVRIAPPADGYASVDLYCDGDCTWEVRTEPAER